MHRVSFKDHLRYRLDQLMSMGALTLVAGLFLAATALILFTAFFVFLTGLVPPIHGHPPDLAEVVWMTLMRVLDAGNLGNDSGSWPFLLTMLMITSAGILFVSTLTGIVTAGIQNKVDVMRKGRSYIPETDHLVILGWSSQIFPILTELLHAHQHTPGYCVAILADRDKVAMEDELHLKLKKPRGTTLVCRSGSPLDLQMLELVNLKAARAIIVLTPEDSQDPDSDVIKTVLAITHHPSRREHPYHIVAAVRSAKNLSVARMVGRQELKVVLTNHLIARLTVQICRQAGLSVVYQEILDFKGNNIHFRSCPALTDQTFREAVFAFDEASILGLRRRDGQILLSPHPSTRLQAGDKLIFLSHSEDQIQLSGRKGYPIELASMTKVVPRPRFPETTLILGWNQNTTSVVNELDAYVAEGSRVHVIADLPEGEIEILRKCYRLQHLKCTFEQADTTDRDVLENARPERYDNIMTMAYSDLLDVQQADAKTLLTLLHLRDMSHQRGEHFSIASEMLDARNRELAQIAEVNDFIVSDKFISMMMAQLAENQELNQIFDELLSPVGYEIYLKPASDYVQLHQPVNFFTVLEAAFARKELALGFKLGRFEEQVRENHGLCLNPPKARQVSFQQEDRIIVLAEN